MRKTIFISILLVLSGIYVSAQSSGQSTTMPGDVTIDDKVEVEHIGPVYSINYRITFGKRVRSCTVELLLSSDGGKSYKKISETDTKGDIGTITCDGDKSISFDISGIRNDLIGRSVKFKVNITDKKVDDWKKTVQICAGVYPRMSYGAMFGMVRKFGWYVKALSDFSFPSAAYECDSSGSMGTGPTWATGNKSYSRLSVTGGAMFRAADWLYPYIGAGYGRRNLYWEDIDGKWAKVSDCSYSGAAIDAGVIFRIGMFAVSAGVSNTAFKYTDIQIGLGISF